MPYPIQDIVGNDMNSIAALKTAGIRTARGLLENAKTPKQRKRLAELTQINEKQILCWANKADRMRIKGIGGDYAELLQVAGVDTVRELKFRNPHNLAKKLAAANAKRKLVRILPPERVLGNWIDQAKTLPLKISY